MMRIPNQNSNASVRVGTHGSGGSQLCLRDRPRGVSLLSKLRKSRGSVLHASLVIGLIISTTPIIDGCSRGQEAPSAPSEQPSVAGPPGAPQESAPAAAQSPPAPPPANPAAAPPGEAAPPPGEAAAPAPALATPQQLQQLVSPIALYPDMLIAQILAASTYPTQVVEAERFVEQNPNLTGDALAAQVNLKPWDPSVRSLCQFPSVLEMMSRNVSWTTQLGGAYYTQPQDVLAAVQVMRRRAMQAGTLRSTSQQRVVVEAPSGGEQAIVIQPAQPNLVYVPTYNPTSVYGAPMPPPPGYSGTQMLIAGVVAGAVGFGAGMLVSSLINNGNNNWGTNWYGGHVVYNRNVFVSNSNYFGGRYPGYRPGYPGYPGNRPSYPAYPGNRPGYPGYANRPGYPGNRPAYPAGYPPRPAPYTGNRSNLAATNPNLKPNMPKPGTLPNRLGMGNQPGPGNRPVGNFPAGRPGKPGGTNLAATNPSKPMTKPANKQMRGNPGIGGGNRRGPNGSVGGAKPGSSSRASGNRLAGSGAGTARNRGATGGNKGTGTTGRRPRAQSSGG
jgi:Protein of unknown function (DUF3300)